MADVRPFRGLLYNTKLVQDLASVVSPPFDTIPTHLQDELYQRSPYNVVRLEAGEQADSDTAQDNRYTRAAATFRSGNSQTCWLETQRLPSTCCATTSPMRVTHAVAWVSSPAYVWKSTTSE